MNVLHLNHGKTSYQASSLDFSKSLQMGPCDNASTSVTLFLAVAAWFGQSIRSKPPFLPKLCHFLDTATITITTRVARSWDKIFPSRLISLPLPQQVSVHALDHTFAVVTTMPELFSLNAEGLESLLKSILTEQNATKILQQEILKCIKHVGQQGEEHFTELKQALAYQNERLPNKIKDLNASSSLQSSSVSDIRLVSENSRPSRSEGNSEFEMHDVTDIGHANVAPGTLSSANTSFTLQGESLDGDEIAMSIDEPMSATDDGAQSGTTFNPMYHARGQQANMRHKNAVDEEANYSSVKQFSASVSTKHRGTHRYRPYKATGRPSKPLRNPVQSVADAGQTSRQAIHPIRGNFSCLTQFSKQYSDAEHVDGPDAQVSLRSDLPAMQNVPTTTEGFGQLADGQKQISFDEPLDQGHGRVRSRKIINKELRWLQAQSEQAGISSDIEGVSRHRATTVRRSQSKTGDIAGNRPPSVTYASADQEALMQASPFDQDDHDLEAVNESSPSTPISVNEQSDLPPANSASGKNKNSSEPILKTQLSPNDQEIAQARTRRYVPPSSHFSFLFPVKQN